MIREFKSRRLVFPPMRWMNAVARWILGVHSSDGSVAIANTPNPGNNGSIDLRVNVDALAASVGALVWRVWASDDLQRDFAAKVKSIVALQVSAGEIFNQLAARIQKRIDDAIGAVETPEEPLEAGGGSAVGGSTDLEATAYDFSSDGNGNLNGVKLPVLSRAVRVSDEVTKLYFRTLTLAKDGRVAAISAEESNINVYSA